MTLPNDQVHAAVVGIAAAAVAGSSTAESGVGKVVLRQPAGLCLRPSFHAGLCLHCARGN